ncbi:DUF4920 domain-containing protein [Pseudoalteromonas sp. MMG012]|uniref:DUF4920 domain-containing protein n=1 Tax=Pseudoalteromonas sp. MMG012 TaxID=2822686 RepID=UPI001B3A45ED|nr:DUF4920 domain-containing protein [Pseudoalteromonas sp. MMG012]MBQ4852451.1 DUF4920 domain-containing protein [Pseudoalteromonas sp. MMG012]
MRQVLFILLLCGGSLTANAEEFAGGADMSKLVAAKEVLRDISSYRNKPVTLKGIVTKVCKKKGCWMALKVTDNDEITVEVKDGVMVFPLSAVGRSAFATGEIVTRVMDLEKTRKYLVHKALENAEPFNPNEVTTPMSVHILKPSSVTILQ